MEAPDKIYVGISPSRVGEGLVYTTVSNEYPYAKEYIRKDMLIEWLENRADLLTKAVDKIEIDGIFGPAAKKARNGMFRVGVYKYLAHKLKML